jgi:hypothetical protein
LLQGIDGIDDEPKARRIVRRLGQAFIEFQGESHAVLSMSGDPAGPIVEIGRVKGELAAVRRGEVGRGA